MLHRCEPKRPCCTRPIERGMQLLQVPHAHSMVDASHACMHAGMHLQRIGPVGVRDVQRARVMRVFREELAEPCTHRPTDGTCRAVSATGVRL